VAAAYLLFFVLLILTAVIVAAEMATYSTRKERLLQLAQQGNRSARLALLYLRRPRWYLAGSQLAMTLTTTIMGLLSSQLFSQPLSIWFESVGLTQQAAGTAGFWTATVGLTLFLTVFINLLPKRFAFAYADEVAVSLAKPSRIWIKATSPILAGLNWFVDVIARPFGIRDASAGEVTEADVLTWLAEGRKDRLIDPHEYEIVRNALALSDRKVSELMTPRGQVVWIDLNASDDRLLRQKLCCGRSQAPVSQGNLDNVQGYVKVRELLALDGPLTKDHVIAALQPVVRVPKTATALQVLNTLKKGRARLAFVCEDHGHILGLISLNDLVMAVLGELEPIKD
jgi:putative hemolysin